MKKYFSITIALLLLGVLLAPNTFADYAEKARVIKADEDQNDLIVERQNGERWLIQHNRQCTSMSTEFPVTLLSSDGIITQLKVNFNEICKVYHATPYTGEATLNKLIKSENLIIKDHLAEMTFNGKKYGIDYREGCNYFWDFLDKRVYINLSGRAGEIILPSARGQCAFKVMNELGTVEEVDPNTPPGLKGLAHQAQNNQVYFYWEKNENDDLLYAISYSRYKIDPNEYKMNELPHLIRTRRNSFTIRRLMNNRLYYFYLAAINENGTVGEWSEIKITPIPGPKVTTSPLYDRFEIKLEETEDGYRLFWPEKPNARRFITKLYVDGKMRRFKVLKEGVHELFIEKIPELMNKRLRFTIKSLSRSRFGPTYYDGHFWVYRGDE